MSVAIIGYTGLVGSYLRRMHPHAERYRSTNIGEIAGRAFDTVYCAGMSAAKWYANAHPDEDRAALERLWAPVKTVTCARFVLISTIDVYGASEYGATRRELERRVRTCFSSGYQIVRLCGLFGYGIRKNLLYDFLHGRLATLNTNDAFQWYSMTWLAADLRRIERDGVHECDLFTEPVANLDLVPLLRDAAPSAAFRLVDSDTPVRYDVLPLAGAYVRTKAQVLAALGRFLRAYLRPAVQLSNLCCADPVDTRALADLYGLKSVEVAPHKHFGSGFIDQPLTWFHQFRNDGIHAFQALYYPHTWTLRDDYDAVLAYTRKLVDIACFLGVRVLVFGSPALRRVESEADVERFVEFARAVGDHIGARGLKLCIEANARAYGCNFITTNAECAAMVERIGHANVRMVLDTGCTLMEQQSVVHDLERFAPLVAHVHFSAPRLGSVFDVADLSFPNVRRALDRVRYTGLITLEMLTATREAVEDSLVLALSEPSLCVVGGGWYGCHLALQAHRLGYAVELHERATRIMSGASGFNQNRLHCGFHYPRSAKTRSLCVRGFDRFMEGDYAALTREVPENVYAIADGSVLDMDTYTTIMSAHELDFMCINPDYMGLQNCEDALYVGERHISAVAAREYFQRELLDVCVTESPIAAERVPAHEWVIDCTNGALAPFPQCDNCYTLSLVYRVLHPSHYGRAYTVMDGDFFSVFPFDMDQHLVTLTHVRLGVVEDEKPLDGYAGLRDQIERDVLRYLPDFRENYAYHSHFVSRKAKQRSASASRHVLFSATDRMLSVTSGKITGIYDAWEFLGLE